MNVESKNFLQIIRDNGLSPIALLARLCYYTVMRVFNTMLSVDSLNWWSFVYHDVLIELHNDANCSVTNFSKFLWCSNLINAIGGGIRLSALKQLKCNSLAFKCWKCRRFRGIKWVLRTCSMCSKLFIKLHRVPKKLSRFVFVRTSSNFHKFR